MGVTIVTMATSVTIGLAFMTYNKFGWRIYSRLACDLRLKNAAERTLIYFAQNRFTTLVKLDFQVLFFVKCVLLKLCLVSGVDLLDWYCNVNERGRIECGQ